MRHTVVTAAIWLPFLLGAGALGGHRLDAQTTGLPPVLSGDCTVNAAGVAACTRTNGTAFAPSAVTDATNATNITSGTLPVAQVPIIPSTKVSGLAPSATTDATNGSNVTLEPKYVYAGRRISQFMARQSLASTSQTSYIAGPTHVVMFADSKAGYYLPDLLLREGNNQALNGLGALSFYSGLSGNYGSLVTTFANTGTACTLARNDVTSAYSFGPSGSYVDCPSGAIITYTPTPLLPYDVLAVTTRTNTAGGTYTLAVNGATLQTVNTAGAEAMAYTLVNSGFNHAQANVTVLTVTTGIVRFYTVGSWQKAQSGLVVHLLNSGGSLLQQWSAQPAYAAQYLAAVSPAEVKIELETNDAGSAVPAGTNATNLNAFLTGLNLSAMAIPPDVQWITEWDRGTVSGATCVADASGNALLDAYRANVFNAQAAWGYSILDMRSAVPSFAQAYADGLYLSDCIHPTANGASLVAQKIALGDGLRSDPVNDLTGASLKKQTVLFMPRAGSLTGMAVAQFQSGGGVVDSGTGVYSNGDFSHLEHRLQSTLYDRFGQAVGTYNTNMSPSGAATFPYTLGGAVHTFFPDATYPCPLYSYRNASTANTSFSLCTNTVDANLDLDLWNVNLVVSNQGKPWFNFANLLQGVFSSDAGLAWTSSASTVTTAGGGARGAVDTGISRSASGVVSLDTTTKGNAAGALALAGIQPGVTTLTASGTLTVFNATVLCNATSGAVTITLPAAATKNLYLIKKIDASANACTVSGNGHNVDGGAATTITAQYGAIRLQGDGTQWWLY